MSESNFGRSSCYLFKCGSIQFVRKKNQNPTLLVYYFDNKERNQNEAKQCDSKITWYASINNLVIKEIVLEQWPKGWRNGFMIQDSGVQTLFVDSLLSSSLSTSWGRKTQ